jgi:hypothetical protein
MNPYLVSVNNAGFSGIQLLVNNAGFSGIQLLLATKELVTNVRRDPIKLLFALVIPVLLPKLLLINNNHTMRAFMMNHS